MTRRFTRLLKKNFAYRGCYFLNKSETEKVRKTIIINGALNAKIVGQKAHTIAALAGVTVPEETKFLSVSNICRPLRRILLMKVITCPCNVQGRRILKMLFQS